MMCVGFELQKLIQFNFFFRLKCLATDYMEVLNRVNSVAYKEFMKVGLVDFAYLVFLTIGLFTINNYFLCGIIFLSVMQSILFRLIKNKSIRKVSYILEILLSLTLLVLSIINILYYNIDGILLIKQLFNI